MSHYSRRALFAGFFFLFIRLLLAHNLPLSPDEAYYWLWAKNPDLSYFDHPPMVAWWIMISTYVFGQSELAVRLLAVLSIFLISMLAYHIASKEASQEWALRLVVAIQLIPLFNLGGVIITPDTPLVFFWSLSLVFFIKAYNNNRIADWLITGLCLGLGLLSKYSMILFVPAMIFAVFYKSGKSETKAKKLTGLFVSLATALLLFLPVLIFNYQHDFISFLFQLKHGVRGNGSWFENLSGFVAAQIFLFSPGFLWMFLKMFFSKGSESFSGFDRLLMPFAILPVMIFTLSSFVTHPEAGWAACSYIAALWLVWRHHGNMNKAGRSWHYSVFAAAVFTLLLYAYAFNFFGYNRTLEQKDLLLLEGSRMLELLPDGADLPILAENYQIASLWTYYLGSYKKPAYVLPSANHRKSQFDLWQAPDISRGFIWIGKHKNQRKPAIPADIQFGCTFLYELKSDKILQNTEFSFLICQPNKA